MPTVINVDIDITFLEALSKFKVNYELDDFVVRGVLVGLIPARLQDLGIVVVISHNVMLDPLPSSA